MCGPRRKSQEPCVGELTEKDSISYKKVALNSLGHLKMCGPGQVGKATPPRGGGLYNPSPLAWTAQQRLESACTLVGMVY